MMHQRRIWIDHNFVKIKKAEFGDNDVTDNHNSRASYSPHNGLIGNDGCKNDNITSNGGSRIDMSHHFETTTMASSNGSDLNKKERSPSTGAIYKNDLNGKLYDMDDTRAIIDQQPFHDHYHQPRCNHDLALKDLTWLPYQHHKQQQPLFNPSISGNETRADVRDRKERISSESKQKQQPQPLTFPSPLDSCVKTRFDKQGGERKTKSQHSNDSQEKKTFINFSIEHILAGKIDSNPSSDNSCSKMRKEDSTSLKDFDHNPIKTIDKDLRYVYPLQVLPSPISPPLLYHGEEGREASVDGLSQKYQSFDHHGLGYIYTTQGHEDYPPLFDWLNCTRYNPPKISSKFIYHYSFI